MLVMVVPVAPEIMITGSVTTGLATPVDAGVDTEPNVAVSADFTFAIAVLSVAAVMLVVLDFTAVARLASGISSVKETTVEARLDPAFDVSMDAVNPCFQTFLYESYMPDCVA